LVRYALIILVHEAVPSLFEKCAIVYTCSKMLPFLFLLLLRYDSTVILLRSLLTKVSVSICKSRGRTYVLFSEMSENHAISMYLSLVVRSISVIYTLSSRVFSFQLQAFFCKYILIFFLN